MANKENSTDLSGRNHSVDSPASTVAGDLLAVLNPHNDNKRRASILGNSASDDSTAKKQKLDAPSNIEQLRQFFDDAGRMNQFSFKQIADDWCGLFEIHSVADSTSYMSFHCDETIKQLHRSDVKIFVYFSNELLSQFQRFGVQFHGIEQILMVFVNHKIDRITPLGIFFLPNRSQPILDDVMRVIGQQLNDGSKTVITCTSLYDAQLQDSISRVWPTAKLIGCSEAYQKDVKLFAKQNRVRSDQDKDLTRLASNLCYVAEQYIAMGIGVIEKRAASEYGVKLVRYLRTEWIHLQSFFNEEIIHRSVKVCRQFMRQMIEDHFEPKLRYSSPKKPLKHIVDFIDVLRTFSKSQIFDMGVDGTVYERRRKRRFEMNTERQKNFEANVVTSFEELRQSIELLQNDGTAIENAIENFLNKVAA